MITLVTPTQCNPIALRRTIDNAKNAFAGLLNEVVVADLSVFPGNFNEGFEDVRIIPMEFNRLFKEGFSNILNILSGLATNDLCLYLNVGEIVEKNLNTSLINDQFNCYSFNHADDPHIWVRMWNRKELNWSGRIHEEIVGPRRQCPDILFQMADTEKDLKDDFRAGVYNDAKEILYFHQYIEIADHPEQLGATNIGWLNYARAEYDDLKRRLESKGDRYRAFIDGNLPAYLAAAEKDKPSKEWSKP